MQFRTPLSKVKGLGSAKEGVHHWWLQRLTAVALVPLIIWFVVSLMCVAGSGYEEAAAWISRPLNSVLMILLVAVTMHHTQLGIQIVIEDYVEREMTKLMSIMLVKFLAALLAVIGVVSVLRVSLGG